MHSIRKKKKSEAEKFGMSGKSGYSRKISGLFGLSAH
jgi:hypothetical protein